MDGLLPIVLDALRPPVLDFLLDVEAGAADVLDRYGRTDTGETKRGLNVTPPEVEGGTLAGAVGAAAPQSYYVHEGRQPGKPPPYMPIAEWVERKLGVEPSGVYPVTQSIRRKIAARGTDGTRFFALPIDALAPFLADELATAAAGVGAEVTGLVRDRFDLDDGVTIDLL